MGWEQSTFAVTFPLSTFALHSRRRSEGRLSRTWAFIRWLVQVIEMPWLKSSAWLLRFEGQEEKSGLERWAKPEGSRSQRASFRHLIWVFALIMKRHAAGTLIIHLKEYGLIIWTVVLSGGVIVSFLLLSQSSFFFTFTRMGAHSVAAGSDWTGCEASRLWGSYVWVFCCCWMKERKVENLL